MGELHSVLLAAEYYVGMCTVLGWIVFVVVEAPEYCIGAMMLLIPVAFFEFRWWRWMPCERQCKASEARSSAQPVLPKHWKDLSHIKGIVANVAFIIALSVCMFLYPWCWQYVYVAVLMAVLYLVRWWRLFLSYSTWRAIHRPVQLRTPDDALEG